MKSLIKIKTKMSLIALLISIVCLCLLTGCNHTTIVEKENEHIGSNLGDENKVEDNTIVIPDVSEPPDGSTDKELDILDKESTNTEKPEVIEPSKVPAFRHYRSMLQSNSVELELYDAISYGLEKIDKKISIPIVTDTSKISTIYEFVRMDNPQFFYSPTKFKILSTKVNGTVSAMEIEFQYDEYWDLNNISYYKDQIDIAATEALQNVLNVDGDYNKVLYLYKFLSKNIKYKSDSEADYNIYGALVLKGATCEGFAESFQYLLNLIEIDAMSVVGESKNQPHEWNMAKIDGQWYFFDVTWDSPTNTDKYLPFNYFALNREDIRNSHVIYYMEMLPEAVYTKYNYYYYNDLVLYSYSEKNAIDLSKISHNINPNHISFRAANEETYNLVLGEISTWVPKALKNLGVIKSEISYMSNDDLNIIDIVLKEETEQ